jgi:hypothetical protein
MGLIVAHAISSLEFRLETHFPGIKTRSALEDAHARISNVLHGRPLPGSEVRMEGGSVPKVVHSVVKDSWADLLNHRPNLKRRHDGTLADTFLCFDPRVCVPGNQHLNRAAFGRGEIQTKTGAQSALLLLIAY